VIISVVNQKGGVGKTTTSLNLGAALAGEDERAVLLIDLDVTQRDLTTYGEGAVRLVTNGFYPDAGLHLTQCNSSTLPGVLRKHRNEWDFILIDCPPSLGKETGAALKASDLAVVPLQPEAPAASGLARILQTIEAARQTRRGGNADLQTKILLTMLDARDKSALQVAADLRRRFGSMIFEQPIKRSPVFTKAALKRQTILQYSPRCHGAAGYEAAARELLQGNA